MWSRIQESSASIFALFPVSIRGVIKHNGRRHGRPSRGPPLVAHHHFLVTIGSIDAHGMSPSQPDVSKKFALQQNTLKRGCVKFKKT